MKHILKCGCTLKGGMVVRRCADHSELDDEELKIELDLEDE